MKNLFIILIVVSTFNIFSHEDLSVLEKQIELCEICEVVSKFRRAESNRK